MTALNVSRIELLPQPETPQSEGEILDRDKFGDAFLLHIDYPGKATGQQVDFTFELHVDRFSPVMPMYARFTTKKNEKEEVKLAATLFDFRTQDGWVLISYEAKIAEVPKPSSTLHRLIKDRPLT